MARWFAKKRYLWTQECEAATADLHAGLSLKLAAEKRVRILQLNKEADDIDANIKAVDEKLAKGYWECVKGHEIQSTRFVPGEDNICPDCNTRARYISSSTMTGQEKYESDKERTEAQTMGENKRAQAKAEEENVKGSEQTAKYFQDQAKNSRSISQKIRTL
jgi:hypothetical protein